MKKYFVVISLLLLMNIGIAQKQKEGWQYNYLKGKVKTTVTTRYNKNNKADRTEKQYFDNAGTLLSVISETITDELWFTTIERYEYDAKGNLAYRTSTDYDRKRNERNDDSTIWVFKYDDKGNRIGTEAGDLGWKDTYDEKGNLVQSLSMRNGIIDGKITITRNGNTSEEKIFDAAGEYQSSEFAKYNAQKNYTERSTYDADGKLITRRTYTYNKNNDLVSLVTTGITGSDTLTYTYVYDSMQNWTSKTQIKDGVKQSTEKRDIEYY